MHDVDYLRFYSHQMTFSFSGFFGPKCENDLNGNGLTSWLELALRRPMSKEGTSLGHQNVWSGCIFCKLSLPAQPIKLANSLTPFVCQSSRSFLLRERASWLMTVDKPKMRAKQHRRRSASFYLFRPQGAPDHLGLGNQLCFTFDLRKFD